MQAYRRPDLHRRRRALSDGAASPSSASRIPYELNEDQYTGGARAAARAAAARPALLARRHRAGRRLHERGRRRSASWPYQVNLLQSATSSRSPARSPTEGATGWADTTMMHAERQHPNCAYKWLEHSLSRRCRATLAAWFGSVPVVPAACKGNALLGADGCKTNGFENFDKIKFWQTPVAKCASAGRRLRALLPMGDGLHRDPGRRADRGARGEPPSSSRTSAAHFGDGARRRRRVASPSRTASSSPCSGPSGSGKTTCLRLIAGFEQPDRRQHPAPRPDVPRRAALRARRQHRVPGLRAVPAHDRARQRRLRAA